MSKIESFNEQYKRLFSEEPYNEVENIVDEDAFLMREVRAFTAVNATLPKVEEKPVMTEHMYQNDECVSVSDFVNIMKKREKASSEIEDVKGGVISVSFDEKNNLITFSDGYRTFYINTYTRLYEPVNEPMDLEAHTRIVSAVIRHCATYMAPFGIYKIQEFNDMIARESLKSYDPDNFMIGTMYLNKVYAYMFSTNISDVAEKIASYGIREKSLYGIMATMISVVTKPESSFDTVLMYGDTPQNICDSLKSLSDELTGYTCNFDEVDEDDDNESLIDLEEIIEGYRLPEDLINMIMAKGGTDIDDETDDDNDGEDEDDDDCIDVDDIELDLQGRQ